MTRDLNSNRAVETEAPAEQVERNMLALVREADENATDGELDVWMSYRVRWHAFLGGGAS